MDTRTVERVEEWATRSVPDGLRGLRDLLDGSFSGAVENGGAWLFALNGRVVGVFDGPIEAFEDGTATAHEAPDPAVVLLAAMQERGGTTRGRYYTEDTPLSEVDDTLSEGGFTGYVELSENVLSGDYYVVYHGGRSMSAAVVGASETLLTGEEAFERAADEVGIYEVVDVDVEVVDLPEPEPDDPEADDGDQESDADAVGAAGAGAAATAESEADDRPASGQGAGTDEPAASESATPDDDQASAGDDAGVEAAGEVAEDEVDSVDEGPGPDPGETGGDEPTHERAPGSDGATADAGDAVPVEEAEPDASPRPAADDGGDGDGGPVSDAGATPDATADAASTETADATAAGEARSEGGRTDAGGRSRNGGQRATDESSPTSGSGKGAAGAAAGGAAGDGSDADDGPDATAAAAADDEDVFSEEEQWRETNTIPALDPEESLPGSDGDGNGSRKRVGPARATRREPDASAGADRPNAGTGRSESGAGRSDAGTDGPDAATLRRAVQKRERRLSELQDRLADVEAEREELAGENEELREERDRLVAERDELAAERDRLADELQEARAELASVREELRDATERLERAPERTAGGGGGGSGGGQSGGAALSASEALDGTNLFVRYRSKGEPTLESARDGGADRDAVDANLRLEHHTQFAADESTVDGEPYESFLRESLEYRFVDWLVRELLHEVRDAGKQSGLGDLYEAIPEIDRAQLHGTVTVEPDNEDGEATERVFDVVLRDKMGRPLVVADLSTGRSPVGDDGLESLVDDATAVGSTGDRLAAAFYVTASFFRPDALEAASGATGGGFLSRDKRESYVRTGRKTGYHLCLVEAREGSFHVSIPEL